jgi:hypothetical protein
VSWIRNWLNRARQEDAGTPPPGSDEQGSASSSSEGSTGQGDQQQGFHIRDAERRQLRRLLRRQDDLTYDLQRAEEALSDENQWTERIEQLNQAIEQAMADRSAIEPVQDPSEPPRPQLDPVPVEVAAVREEEPASITLRIGTTELSYREEIDWAERGHNVTIPELRRVSGDVEPLLPALGSDTRAQELREHLRHSLSTYANQVLEHTAAGTSPPEMTLAAMTRTCSSCGGWLDQKDRCPICADLNWQRQEIDTDLRRLRKERDDVISDLERQRDRIPIVRRQLAETQADIKKLREKGVEPAAG